MTLAVAFFQPLPEGYCFTSDTPLTLTHTGPLLPHPHSPPPLRLHPQPLKAYCQSPYGEIPVSPKDRYLKFARFHANLEAELDFASMSITVCKGAKTLLRRLSRSVGVDICKMVTFTVARDRNQIQKIFVTVTENRGHAVLQQGGGCNFLPLDFNTPFTSCFTKIRI